MKFSVEIQYRKPPAFSTIVEADTASHAEQLAANYAKQNGFKDKPKKILTKEVEQ